MLQACEILFRTQSPELPQSVGNPPYESLCQEAALNWRQVVLIWIGCLMRALGFSSLPGVYHPRVLLPAPSGQTVHIPLALPLLCIGLV